jgi:hypothetical protein
MQPKPQKNCPTIYAKLLLLSLGSDKIVTFSVTTKTKVAEPNLTQPRNLVKRANHLSARKHTDIIFYAYFDHGLHIQ